MAVLLQNQLRFFLRRCNFLLSDFSGYPWLQTSSIRVKQCRKVHISTPNGELAPWRGSKFWKMEVGGSTSRVFEVKLFDGYSATSLTSGVPMSLKLGDVSSDTFHVSEGLFSQSGLSKWVFSEKTSFPRYSSEETLDFGDPR